MICREHLFAALTSDFPLSMATFRIGWRNLLFWKIQNPKITWGISNSVLDSMECKTISVNGWLTFTLKIDSWYHMLSCGFRVNVSATKAAHHFKTSKMQDFVELQNFRSFFFSAAELPPLFHQSSPPPPLSVGFEGLDWHWKSPGERLGLFNKIRQLFGMDTNGGSLLSLASFSPRECWQKSATRKSTTMEVSTIKIIWKQQVTKTMQHCQNLFESRCFCTAHVNARTTVYSTM